MNKQALRVEETEVGMTPAAAVDGIAQLLKEAHRATARALQARIAAHGVSIGQWYFLRALWEEEGLTQRELSNRVGMMEPTTVTALNGMERQGLVRRVRNEHDRRKMNVFLTDRGHDLRDILAPTAVEIDELAFEGFSAVERAAVHSFVQRMIDNLNRAA